MNKNVRDMVSLTIVFFALCFIVYTLKSVGGHPDDTSGDRGVVTTPPEPSAPNPASAGSGYPIDLQRWE